MNASVEDLRPTIIPKSDQLNAEQLLGGPMTVTVTEVSLGSGEDQPVVVHYAGEGGRPFKPCKTMRKVLIHAWGPDGRNWAGRSMTLYNDPAVKFGGEDVGGIRISHMTDIDRDVRVSLTSTRGKKAKYEIKRLVSAIVGQLADIARSPSMEALKDNYEAAYRATNSQSERDQLTWAKDKRKAELQKAAQPAAQTIDVTAYAAKLKACTDVDILDLAAEELRDIPDAALRTRLTDVYKARRAELAG